MIHDHVDRVRVQLREFTQRDPAAPLDWDRKLNGVLVSVRGHLAGSHRLAVNDEFDEPLAALISRVGALHLALDDRVADEAASADWNGAAVGCFERGF